MIPNVQLPNFVTAPDFMGDLGGGGFIAASHDLVVLRRFETCCAMGEEIRHPQINIPRAMMLAVHHLVVNAPVSVVPRGHRARRRASRRGRVVRTLRRGHDERRHPGPAACAAGAGRGVRRRFLHPERVHRGAAALPVHHGARRQPARRVRQAAPEIPHALRGPSSRSACSRWRWWTSTLDYIASLSLFADLFYYVIGMVACLGLRRKLPDLKRPFKVHGMVPGAVISIAIYLVMMTQLDTDALVTGVIYCVVGLVIYAACAKVYGTRAIDVNAVQDTSDPRPPSARQDGPRVPHLDRRGRHRLRAGGPALPTAQPAGIRRPPAKRPETDNGPLACPTQANGPFPTPRLSPAPISPNLFDRLSTAMPEQTRSLPRFPPSTHPGKTS